VKTFQFRTEQRLPRPLAEVFEFFSDAHNLEKLTPGWLSFDVLTPKPIPMAVGTTIDYRLRWRGIPLRWTSEIAAWEPPHRFVDRQIRGPYRLWHHEHRFSEADGGTRVADEVTYAVWGGGLVNRLGVARDVETIFDYRRRVLEALFGEAGTDGA